MINWRDCIIPVKNTRSKGGKKYNRTIREMHTRCEFCENACGFCDWSRYGVHNPVQGWDAIRRDVLLPGRRSQTYTESYIVIGCPEFVLQENWAKEFNAVDWEKIKNHALKSSFSVDKKMDG